MALGGSLRDLADRIVHGAQESFVAALTSRLATLLVGLVRGSASSSPARVEVAAALASQTARTEAMAVWAEHSQGVSAEVRREVEASLTREDETLVRSLADEAGGVGPTLTNRGRNDLAEATRGVREVTGRDNVEDELISRTASAAASAVSRQDATLASTTAEEWYRIAGEAITRTQMGDDPEAVIADAVAELARAGVETVDYRSGVSTTIDAAVRRHVDTQKNQCMNDLTVRRCEEWGVGLVCVDAHFGARPSHARWQGKAYSLDGEQTIDGVTYPDLYEATGYQGRNGWPLGERLAGVNCRHVIYPYVPGVTEIPGDDMEAMEEKYGMSSEEYYRATQRQRSLERRIREKKREVAVGEDQGLDMTERRYELGDLQRRMRELLAETGLERDPVRERAYGVSHQPRGLVSQSAFSKMADDAVRTAEPGASIKTYSASSIRTRNGFTRCNWAYQREYGAVYDSRGRIVSDVFVGDSGSVLFRVPSGFDWTDTRVVHTHPGKEGGTLSSADVFHLTDGNLLSYEAVAREGVYSLERLATATETSRKKFAADYAAFEETVSESRYFEVERQYLERGLDPYLSDYDEFSDEVLRKMHSDQHEWLKEHVVEYGYRYSFKPRRS